MTAIDTTPLSLWRNKDFQLLWSGSAFSLLANELNAVAFPLLILAISHSPAWAGAFGGVQMTAAILLGVPAGAWVDRHDRRRLLMAAECVKTVVLGALAMLLMLNRAELWHLLLGALLVGALQPFAGSARMLMVRHVVPPQQLTAALTQDEIRTNAIGLGGPPLAGFAYGLGAAVPVLVSGSLAFFSLCLTTVVDPRAGRIESAADPGGGTPVERVLKGFQVLWRNPVLRLGTAFAAASNMAMAPLMLITIVELTRSGASPVVIGATMSALAVGGLLGTFAVRPLQRRLRPGWLMLLLGTVSSALVACLSMVQRPWAVGLVLALIGVGGPSVRILIDILIFRRVPDAERGRAVTAFMTVLGVGSSLGIFATGLLLELQAWLAVGLLAAVLLTAVLVGFSDRQIRAAEWPPQT